MADSPGVRKDENRKPAPPDRILIASLNLGSIQSFTDLDKKLLIDYFIPVILTSS